MTQDIVILAGGHGTRMGPLAQEHGCKSLIPINGAAALEWLLRALQFVFVDEARIFLCIEREEIYPGIERVMRRVGGKRTQIFCSPELKGTMHALYLLRDTLQGERVFVLYGHQPVLPAHLLKILRRRGARTITTLYPTSSNVSRKISVINGKGRITDLLRGGEEHGLGENEYYIDVPYLLPMEFVQAQPDDYIKSHEAIMKWLQAGNPVQGEVAHFPHEFHYPHELPSIERFVQRFPKKLLLQTA
ncbi:MAG: NTP transferase domain-containing protein [Candidatus Wildermuthbacteria bacterium]|nr:NTP transferase domain-containing protein [Candidatus Wildermuthbacteria bacterium]